MEIHVLGASGGCTPGRPPSSFLVDGCLAVDAGALATSLDLAAQERITDVLLTHSHLDHVRDLPLLLINADRSPVPLRVHASAETLEALRTHLFNVPIWFEAFSTPSPERPMLHGVAQPMRTPVEIAGFRATGFPLRHTCPCAGWLVEDGEAAVYFCGDTDQVDCLEGAVRAAGKRLRAVFLEASYPDRMEQFAVVTRHLTPATMGLAVRALPRGIPVFVTHMKPGFEEEIAREIAALRLPAARPVEAGEVLRF